MSVVVFSFQPVVHSWCNKGCGMVHIQDPLLLIKKCSSCSGHSKVLSRHLSGRLPYV